MKWTKDICWLSENFHGCIDIIIDRISTSENYITKASLKIFWWILIKSSVRDSKRKDLANTNLNVMKVMTNHFSNLIKNPIYIDVDEKNQLPRNSALKIKPKIKQQLEQKFRLRIQDFSSPLGNGLFGKSTFLERLRNKTVYRKSIWIAKIL